MPNTTVIYNDSQKELNRSLDLYEGFDLKYSFNELTELINNKNITNNTDQVILEIVMMPVKYYNFVDPPIPYKNKLKTSTNQTSPKQIIYESYIPFLKTLEFLPNQFKPNSITTKHKLTVSIILK